MGTMKLNREGARALLTEARRDFANGSHELFAVGDEGQRPVIAACTEIIARLEQAVDEYWPHEQVGPDGMQYLEEVALVEFAFTDDTLAWMERQRIQQAGFVSDLDSGIAGVGDLGYHAEQVYLLHVLTSVCNQRDEAPEEVAV